MSQQQNSQQRHTKRSNDWHDEPVFGATGEHRKQTRYEQRSVREKYKRKVRTELMVLCENCERNDCMGCSDGC